MNFEVESEALMKELQTPWYLIKEYYYHLKSSGVKPSDLHAELLALKLEVLGASQRYHTFRFTYIQETLARL